MKRIVILWAVLWVGTHGIASALDLVTDGKPTGAIVTPDEALPVVAAAAEELQYHVRRASGATLPIVKESQCQSRQGLIYLGPCAATLKLGIQLGELKPNGFFIRNAGGNLHLVGDDSAGDVFWIQHNNRTRVGTLFAVYEVLEKHLGARWLWPGPLGEVIPRGATVRLNVVDQTFAPPFVHTRWRDGGIYMAGPKGWAAPENRSRYLNEQGKWLRRHRFAMGINMDMAHSFTNWWDRFAKEHPEYFNLLPDGTRRSDPLYHGAAPSLISMCVGQPGLWRQKIADWQALRSPQRPHVDASENDTPGKCVCALCLAMDAPDPNSEVAFDKRAEEAKKAFDARDAHWEKALGSMSDRYARYYLALQKEAEKVDPQAVVMGYAYANYAKPPLQTKLNSRVIIGIVPALMYPWTAEKRRAFIEQWNGWSAAGARLLLRPNYMLDGHCLPIHFARALGQDFSFAIQHGLIGTDFDSLTGQWSTQGPNLYVLARLHAAPSLTVEQCLDEYSAGFGKATRAVRAYFAHWESVSNSVTPEAYKAADLHWSRFHRDADAIFTPEVMRRGRELLDQALAAAKGDADAEARMAFLDKGLRNAELTLATQQAYRGYRASGELDPYVAALEKLDSYRASVEGDFVANMAYLAWSETYTWDRDLIRMMRQPGARLPDPWKFMWDPDKVGERDRWFDEDFDAARWHDISTTGSWEMQEIGRQWKEAHKEDYNGIAWYRTSFKASQPEKPARIQLVFGAVDEACKIWLNGRLALERPYPYKGNPDSWRESFELDITSLVRYDKPNVLAVRVEDNAGAGGIWRPVWLTTAESPATDQKNAVKDGGFESQPPAWQQHVQGGRFKFAIDTTQKRSGNASALLECLELAAPDVEQRIRAKSWARWYQAAVPVAAGKAHQFRVWYRTDVDFRGTVKVWVTATEKQTMEAKGLNTRGLWRELRIEGIKSPTGQVSVYLNVMDGTGKVWFDDVELSESPG